MRKILQVVAVTELGRIHGKPTAQCLRGRIFGHYDTNLDAWLPEHQSTTEPCVVTTLEVVADTTLTQCVRVTLGLAKDTPTTTVVRLLGERRHRPTLLQAEAMISLWDGKPDAPMRPDGYGNIIPLKAKGGGTVIGRTHRVERKWPFHASKFDEDIRLGRGRRLHFVELDHSRLGL